LDEQRKLLEQLIESGADYVDIVKQSQKLDMLIVQYYKGSYKNER
jgi:hypothetical protein